MKFLFVIPAFSCLVLPALGQAAFQTNVGGMGGYSMHYGPSTVGESWAVGYANMIAAQGNYNLATSQAINNLSIAQQRNVQTWQMLQEARRAQQMGAAYGAAGPGTSGFYPTRRKWTTEELNALAHRLAPPRPSAEELHPDTGEIAWPSVLRTDDFAPPRRQIESLFAQRAAMKALPVQGYTRLDEAINQLTDELKDRVRQYPADLYVAARRFLRSLAYEAMLAPEGAATAQVAAKPEAAGTVR